MQKPLSRYLHKFHNQRKEVKRLKAHEKDFLFQSLRMLKDEDGNFIFDYSTIEEASEYNFYMLILTYSENLNFNLPTDNAARQIISADEMYRDKEEFEKLYTRWIEQLERKKGKYIGIINTELDKRFKKLSEQYSKGQITKQHFIYQEKYLKTVGFYVYYKVKLFFDSQKDKFISLNISNEVIVFNIYSFVHTLFRHYIPSMDIGPIDRSLNDPLPFFDTINLPISARDLISEYFKYAPDKLVSTKEYLLFTYKSEKYIIWIKYKILEEINNQYGFEFRTLYKCDEERDLNKFTDRSEHKINPDLSFYY